MANREELLRSRSITTNIAYIGETTFLSLRDVKVIGKEVLIWDKLKRFDLCSASGGRNDVLTSPTSASPVLHG
jgi:hypothetical protein